MRQLVFMKLVGYCTDNIGQSNTAQAISVVGKTILCT